MKPLSFLALSVFLLIARPVAAHDSWLIARAACSAVPCEVRMAFITSEHFPHSEHATAPERVDSWVVIHGGQRTTVTDYAIDGHELAAKATVSEPGLYVLAVALQPRFIEIEPQRFEAYLRSESADAALARRMESGQQDKPGREYYSKMSKTFVELGDRPADGHAAAAGHTLEIIPLSNPCRWSRGDTAEVRVLYRGQPAAGARVCAGREHSADDGTARTAMAPPASDAIPGSPATNRTAGAQPPDGHDYHECRQTDPQGNVRFHLSDSGLWFLRTHRIEPLNTPESAASAQAADWQSYWASITFQVQ